MNIDKLLLKVTKPARYSGGEFGAVIKETDQVDIRFAFCFPDTYELGMSNLGLQILYHLINSRPDAWCERVFAPAEDMEGILRENDLPLFSLESRTAINEFDILGFTLQYEMSYTNVLNVLDLSKIPLYSKDRTESDPIVCAGGPCCFNPEPVAPFVDFFVLGDGEEVINEILDLYKSHKASGGSRANFLIKAAQIEGVYVPSLYEIEYDGEKIKSVTANHGAPVTVKKRVVKDLDESFYPTKMTVPSTEAVHDRATLELFRGCKRGCRFCQAGFIYRPVRERSPKRLIEIANDLICNTGYEEIGLSSLSTSDYTKLPELTDELLKLTEKNMINLSLPSLRIDNFSLELMEKAQKVRKSGLTFAPEAGSQRMRDVINKNVTEEDLLKSAGLAFSGGYGGVKLYFMVGLPHETMEDVLAIPALAKKVLDKFYELPKEKRQRGINITVSSANFVPKPHTPFQWARQDGAGELEAKQRAAKAAVRSKQIRFNYHDPRLSFMEGVFARGDRRLGEVLYRAWQGGCKMDGWSEHFNYSKWMEAFSETGIDPAIYTRARDYDEKLPWDMFDAGVDRELLVRENEKAKKCKMQNAECKII